jgi:hypothetical protein
MMMGIGGTEQATLTAPERADNKRSVGVRSISGRSWHTREFSGNVIDAEVIDLNGDAKTELVVSVGELETGEASRDAGKVYAFFAHSRSSRLVPFWDEPLSIGGTPPWEAEYKHCNPAIDDYRDLDGKPGEEIVVSAKRKPCLTRLAIVSGTGTVLGSFWHYGNVDAQRVVTLGKDRSQVIICTGWYNHRDEHQQGRMTRAALILNIGTGGSLTGQWRFGEEPTPESVGSLRAYGHIRLSARAPDGSLREEEAKRWRFADEKAIRVPKWNELEVQLQNGYILTLDDTLQPRGRGWSLANHADKQDGRPVEDVWERLWPLDE